MPIPTLRRVEKPEHGFAIAVPQVWPEEPPDSGNSPYEVARFRLHDGDAWHIAWSSAGPTTQSHRCGWRQMLPEPD